MYHQSLPAATTGNVSLGGAKNKLVTCFILVFSAFGGILFGYDCGIISGIQEMRDWLQTFGYPTDDLQNYPLGYTMSSAMQSLVVSILSVGTIVGSLMSAPIADVVGRKLGIVISAIIFSIGIVMQTASTYLSLFILGRFVAGTGVGMVSCIVPMYQSECAPKSIRGAVVSAYLFFIGVGFLLAAIVNTATQGLDNHASWQIPISIQFVWAAILAGGMMFLPESPAFFIKYGKYDEAIHSLTRITGQAANHPEVEHEYNEIRSNLDQRRAEGSTNTWADCFKKSKNKIALRTWTGIGVQACSMIGGLNYVATYSTSIFSEAHIDNPSPFIIVILMNLAFLIMSCYGSWAIEHYGRRPLLLVGSVGTSVCAYAIGIISVVVPSDNKVGVKMIMTLLFLYITFWAACWGNTSWVIPGEIFPLEIRAKALSLSTASNWFFGFIVVFIAPYLVNVGEGSAGLGNKIFFIWGTTCLIGGVFTYFFIPETQGLSLEEIDMMYEMSAPLKATQYRARLRNQDREITLKVEETSSMKESKAS